MRLWQKKSRADTACPGCAGRMFTVINTIQQVRHGGEACEASTVGFRLSCQTCGMIFSVGPGGPFHHHEQALPWSPVPQPMASRTEQKQEPGAGRVFPMHDSRPKPIMPKSGA